MTIVTRHPDGTITSHDDGQPAPPVRRSPLDVLTSMTPAERAACRAAASASDDVADWWDMLKAAGEIVSDDPRTVAGCQAAVALGLLTPARVAELFGVTVEAP